MQAGRALEPAGRALESAGRVSEPAGRASEPAGRPWTGPWEPSMATKEKKTARIRYVHSILASKRTEQESTGHSDFEEVQIRFKT